MSFLYIPASAIDAAAVNANGIKTLLANNGPKGLPKHFPDWIILDNWVLHNLVSVDR